jgi:hypothetical protein
MLSVLLYNIMSVQIVYSVQLTCTESNYRERDCNVDCVTVEIIDCTDSVQYAAELYWE